MSDVSTLEPDQTPALAPRAEAVRSVRVFNFDVADTTLAEAAHWIVRRALSNVPTSIAFLNAHCTNVAAHDAAYSAAVTGMDRLYGDGIGIRLAARAAGVTLTDNVNGTDLFPRVCALAAERQVPIFLFGAAPGIAAEAARRMALMHPGLAVGGTAHGYIASVAADDAVVAAINASGARIVFVALGVPRQELWIKANRHRLSAPVILGVGGLFDYFSGRLPRAPYIVRQWRCEWVWRLALEPRRLAKRYLAGNVEFLVRLAWQRATLPANFRTPPQRTGQTQDVVQ